MTNEQAELLEIYRSTPVILRALLRNVPDASLRAGGEGEEAWSAVEIICHLRDAEERAFERVRRIRDEERPFLKAYDQAALARESRYHEQSLPDALAAFIRLRQEQTSTLEQLGDDDWSRVGLHEESGEVTIESITAHMAAHDVIHLAQLARRIAPA